MSVAPVESAALVTIFKWVWDTFGKEIIATTAGKPWERVQWHRAAREYAAKVRSLYSTTHILGKSHPVRIEGIYTDVHVLDKPTALRRFTVKQLEEHFSKRDTRYRFAERRGGLKMVQEKDKLFILGKPGAGKTTFCRYIALQAVDGHIDKVPIFVSLKELADSGKNVTAYIVEQFRICNFPDARPFVDQLLRAGKAIVLFDGLDEVQQANDEQTAIVRNIKKFVNRYDKSHYLITCRIAATDYTLERFTYVEMADFTPAQMETFVGKWFGDDAHKRRAFLEEFQKSEHKGLRELAQTPLLLTLLCLNYEETLTFPQRRVEIYEEALDALLKKWDASRNIRRDEIYRKLSLGRKRQMLARIAATTFQDGQYFVSQQILARQIEDYLSRVPSADTDEEADGIGVLKAIEAQHGIFVERARLIYSFAHLTFQEYFTARYIVDNAAGGTLERLVALHLIDHRWREVFLLVASMLDNADALFDLMRCKVDAIAETEEPLSALLAWVDARANTIQLSQYDPLMVRSLYVSLGLTIFYARAFALARARAQDLAVARSRAQDLAVVRARALTIVLDLDLDLDLALALALDRDFPLARELTRDLTLARNHDLDHDRDDPRVHKRKRDSVPESVQDHDLVRHLARDFARIHDFSHPLTRVIALDVTATLDAELFGLLVQFDFRTLHEYLVATHLILDCARLAYVSDRAAIENCLLQPPQQPTP